MNVFLVLLLFPLSLDGVLIQRKSILGSTVELVCPINSSDINWYKGTVLYRCNMTYDRISKTKQYLTIVNIHMSDQAIYKCTSLNDEASFNLTIPALISTDLPHYHRSMKVDYASKLLIIGSMNSIVNIDLKVNPPLEANIMSTRISPTQSNVNLCVLSHSRTPYCQNHIRILAKKSEEIWQACGTNGDSPTGYEYNVTDGSYTSTGNVPCSNNPFHNFTCVQTGSNDSSGTHHMYYGSVYYADKTIQRPIYNADGSIGGYMKGVQSNNWFKDPEFVGSFELKETVLFFFREDAIDVDPNKPKIYSRVAKVCKKDVGGSTQLRNKWTTFQKVRLTCSISGKYPKYFDILQDVVTKDNQIFYGLFTSSFALADSVICAYNLSDIEQAFSGQFKYQPDSTSYWQPVTSVPTPRPGLCINDSLTLPDPTLDFIANNPMMYTNVNSEPKFIQEQESLQLLEIQRDSDQLVFYTASNRGNVYKLVANNTNTYIERNYSVAYGNYESEIIWAMKKLENYLYIGTDNTVRAIHILNSKGITSSISKISRAKQIDGTSCSEINSVVPTENFWSLQVISLVTIIAILFVIVVALCSVIYYLRKKWNSGLRKTLKIDKNDQHKDNPVFQNQKDKNQAEVKAEDGFFKPILGKPEPVKFGTNQQKNGHVLPKQLDYNNRATINDEKRDVKASYDKLETNPENVDGEDLNENDTKRKKKGGKKKNLKKIDPENIDGEDLNENDTKRKKKRGKKKNMNKIDPETVDGEDLNENDTKRKKKGGKKKNMNKIEDTETSDTTQKLERHEAEHLHEDGVLKRSNIPIRRSEPVEENRRENRKDVTHL